jgi:hypothetical protein
MMSTFFKKIETEIKNNIKAYTPDEIFKEYGITILSDDSVYDDVNNRTYNNINEWFSDYLDDSYQDAEIIGKSGYFDDY